MTKEDFNLTDIVQESDKMNDLAVNETKNEIIYKDYDLLNADLGFDTKICIVTDVTNSLSNIIEKQELFITVGSGKHVLVEGWETLGTMLGLKAVTKDVVSLPQEMINTKRSWENVIAYKAELR